MKKIMMTILIVCMSSSVYTAHSMQLVLFAVCAAHQASFSGDDTTTKIARGKVSKNKTFMQDLGIVGGSEVACVSLKKDASHDELFFSNLNKFKRSKEKMNFAQNNYRRRSSKNPSHK